MTTPHAHYFPTLKGRMGELHALRETPPATRAAMTPILELPISEGVEDEAVMAEVEKLGSKLSAHWNGTDPIILDASASAGVAPAGREAVLELHDAVRGDVAAVPTIGLGSSPAFVAAVASIARSDGGGVCIRLTSEDMEDVPRLAAEVTGLVGALSVSPKDVDLVLDVGPIEQHTLPLYAGLVTSVISVLPHLSDWRSLVVLSGSFPASLSDVQANVLSRIPRLDAQLWQRLASRSSGRVPSFGDYAVSHPLMAAPGPWRGAPNLRYTAGDDWFVLKSRLNTPEGNRSYFALCQQLQTMAGSPLDLPTYSWGDQHVHRCASGGGTGGPGGGTQWKAWSTSHHLAKVTDRLATLGAP